MSDTTEHTTEQQVTFTRFANLGSRAPETVTLTWDELRGRFEDAAEYPDKESCPLFSGARFGDQPSPNGSLRHNANVLDVGLVVLDYDAGKIPPEQARDMLELLGIAALVVTTPSNGLPGKGHRYRILARLSAPVTPERWHSLARKLNGLLGGVAARESFTLSQPFYYGRVAGVEYRVLRSEGAPLDQLQGIEQVPEQGPPAARQRTATAPGHPLAMAAKRARNMDDVRDALVLIPNARADWPWWNHILMAIYGATGGSDEGLELAREWSNRCPDAEGTDSVDARWQHFHSSPPTEVGMGTLWHEAGGRPAALNAPDDDSQPDLSHDELALSLGRHGGWNERARYVHKWGAWLFWDGTRWAVDDRLQHMTECREYLRQVARELESWAARKAAQCADAKDAERITKWARAEAKTLRQAQTRANVELMARSNPELAASVGQWDANLDLIGTPGGVVDLRSGELRPASREDYITKHTAATPEHREPRLWLQFLRWAMQGDGERVAFLQRLAGYMLTGYTTEHKLPFAFGPGGNGKSVFANTLFAVMGDYAARAPSEAFLASRNERHPTDLAGLSGARLVVGSELPAGRAWNESVIKDLTGGDPITARYMRQDFFTYTPQFTLLVVGNHQPSIGAVDEAIRRRVLLIPFSAKITDAEKDPQLEEKLRAEHGAILHWMIQGAVEWHRHGLCPPQSVIAATGDYLEAEDTLGQFLADELIADPQAETPSSAVYAQFQAWCRRTGAREWSQRALTQALRERGVSVRKTRGPRVVEGYRLAHAGAAFP